MIQYSAKPSMNVCIPLQRGVLVRPELQILNLMAARAGRVFRQGKFGRWNVVAV